MLCHELLDLKVRPTSGGGGGGLVWGGGLDDGGGGLGDGGGGLGDGGGGLAACMSRGLCLVSCCYVA